MSNQGTCEKHLPPTTETQKAVSNTECLELCEAAGQPEDTVSFRDVWRHRRVLGWCLFILLLPINYGYEITMGGHLMAVTPFLETFGHVRDGVLVILAKDQQLLNSAATIGLFVSAFTTGIISDFLGRKATIIVGCMLCVAGILTQYFSHSINHLFGAKLISTFGFGLGFSLGPVYVAEIAPVNMRGFCLTLVNTMIVFGQWINSLVVLGLNHYPDNRAWRIPIITQVIPPGILLLGLPFLPESPSWLVIKGRHEDAAKSFRKLNGSGFNVDKALADTTAAVAQRQEIDTSTWIQCFKGSDRRRTLIIVMVYITQQFIGVNFIAGYMTYYLRLARVQNPLGIAQAVFAIQLFGNICSWPLVDRVGRRPLIVGGVIAMTCGLLIIGGISTINSQPALNATVAFMCLWGYLYQATLGAVAYAVGGETASTVLRQKTYSINIMSSTAVSCMVLQVMPYLINPDQANLGGKICFIFFGLSMPMCVYLYLNLPELKGRTSAEIDEMFREGVHARKFKTYKCHTNEGMTR